MGSHLDRSASSEDLSRGETCVLRSRPAGFSPCFSLRDLGESLGFLETRVPSLIAELHFPIVGSEIWVDMIIFLPTGLLPVLPSALTCTPPASIERPWRKLSQRFPADACLILPSVKHGCYRITGQIIDPEPHSCSERRTLQPCLAPSAAKP